MRTNETNQKITNGQEEFIMKPYVDWCFKELMRNPKTRQGFIAVLLKVPPEEIGETILLKNELSRRSEEEKQGILDVHVLLRNGIQIDMEMQVAYVDYWDERQMFYLCKMFADQLKKGEGYEKLQKCIQVGILNFTYFHDDDISYHVINFRDNKTMKLYSDKMEIQILELPKIPEGSGSGRDCSMDEILPGAGQKGDGRIGKRKSIFGRGIRRPVGNEPG